MMIKVIKRDIAPLASGLDGAYPPIIFEMELEVQVDNQIKDIDLYATLHYTSVDDQLQFICCLQSVEESKLADVMMRYYFSAIVNAVLKRLRPVIPLFHFEGNTYRLSMSTATERRELVPLPEHEQHLYQNI